jgi:hypothetical protein
MHDAKHLSFNTRKSLCVHMNEKAGTELAEVIEYLLNRIEHLESTKVDVTPISPSGSRPIIKIHRAA